MVVCASALNPPPRATLSACKFGLPTLSCIPHSQRFDALVLLLLLSCPCPEWRGRYATSFDGVLIVDDSSLIHDFYTGECERPVHLVVDTALKVKHVNTHRMGWLQATAQIRLFGLRSTCTHAAVFLRKVCIVGGPRLLQGCLRSNCIPRYRIQRLWPL